MSLVCWKCWGVLHINNLLLGHFGPFQDDNNDGNYAEMDTVFAEMMNKLYSGHIRHTVADIQLRLQTQMLINPPETTKSDSIVIWEVYIPTSAAKRCSIGRSPRFGQHFCYTWYCIIDTPIQFNSSHAQCGIVHLWSRIFLFTTHNTWIQEK